MVLTGLMVSETSVLIPVYQLLQDLELLNTYAGMILPQAALGLTFGVSRIIKQPQCFVALVSISEDVRQFAS